MKINPKILEKFFLIFDKKISEDEINFLLNWKNFWELKKNFYWLNKNKISQKYLEKTLKYKKLFSICPFVKWVFIWNTVAFWSANKKSDIDLFIVFENWRIWIWRLIFTFLIHIFWVRRYWDKNWNKIAWRFCLSFFASEKWSFKLENIQIQKENFKNSDIYLAIWTATLIPIFWNKKFFEEFYKKNKWVKNYLLSDPGVNFKNNFNKNTVNKNLFFTDPGVNFLQKILNFNFIENFIKKILKPRSIKKKKNLNKKNNNSKTRNNNFWIIISDDYLKFHDNDIRSEIMEKLI